jgi:hypothetical protein
LWHFGKKMSENVPIFPKFRGSCCAAYSVKTCFFRTNFNFRNCTKCPGFRNPEFRISEFVPRSKSTVFIYIYKRLQPETMKNTECYLGNFVCIFSFRFRENTFCPFSTFQKFGNLVQKYMFFIYFIIDFK